MSTAAASRPGCRRSAGRGAPGPAAAAGKTWKAGIEQDRVQDRSAADSEAAGTVPGIVKDRRLSTSAETMPDAPTAQALVRSLSPRPCEEKRGRPQSRCATVRGEQAACRHLALSSSGTQSVSAQVGNGRGWETMIESGLCREGPASGGNGEDRGCETGRGVQLVAGGACQDARARREEALAVAGAGTLASEAR